MIYYYFLKQWTPERDGYPPEEYDIIYPTTEFLGGLCSITVVNDTIYVIVDYAEEVVE